MHSAVLYWDCPPTFSRSTQGEKKKQFQKFSFLLFPCSPSSFSGSATLMVPSTKSGIKVQCSLISNETVLSWRKGSNRNPSRCWWNRHWEANWHLTSSFFPLPPAHPALDWSVPTSFPWGWNPPVCPTSLQGLHHYSLPMVLQLFQLLAIALSHVAKWTFL